MDTMRLCCTGHPRDPSHCVHCPDDPFKPKAQGDGDPAPLSGHLSGYIDLTARTPHPEPKETNPKDAIGATKLSTHMIPRTALAWMALAFMEGALKYGKFNWRVAGVRASIYLDAIERHLAKYSDGEFADRETGIPHLASVMACCAIILDSQCQGKLTDDRPPASLGTSELIDSMQSKVAHLKNLFASHTPHQHTIEDGR